MKINQNIQAGFAACFILGFMVTSVFAEGSFKLICHTGQGNHKIILNEENGIYSGQIHEGLTGVTPVEIRLEQNFLTVSIGNEDFPIERIDLGGFIAYGGVILGKRGFSGQAERREDSWILTGMIEDEMNRLVEYQAEADEKNGRLELLWDNNILSLRKNSDRHPGECRGYLINGSSDQMGRFWCQTSGSLKDAFFNDPDQIIAWIIQLFVK